MRVLMLLSTSSVTGPAELCLDDARGLRSAGHEVLFGLDTRRPGNYSEAVRRDGFAVMDELTLCPRPTLPEIARDAARLRARMRSADLVHCRFAHDHAVALLAAAGLWRRPALVRTAEIARSLRPGWLRGLAFRASDAVVVACRAHAERLERDHSVARGRIHLLAGRVDGARFSPGDGSAARASMGVGPGEVLFGIVSRIKEERRHAPLVRAFARVATAHPEARLALVGRGEFEPSVRALVERLGVSDRVCFAGYRTGEGLVEAYRAFDVAVWLAEGNDGTCRALLEGLACGRPAVTAREGAMGELVRDGVEGFAVEPEESALARALEKLLQPPLRARMGAAARARALEHGPQQRARGLAAVYRAALEVRPRRPGPARSGGGESEGPPRD